MTLFLWQSVNEKLRPELRRELKPGTRVVSYVHSMGDWPPMLHNQPEEDHANARSP